MIKREVQSFYPIPDDRFFIAHPGADLPAANSGTGRNEWRKKLKVDGRDVLLIFVGTEFKRKGLGALIAALGILKNQPCKLVVLGGGDPDGYEQQAAALQIGDRITWAGLVKNTTDYYAASDIFVLPTLSDAGPMAPLEAMAHGCAAIFSCATYAGMAELINNDEAVLLKTPGDPAEIASAIERLMNPAIRADYAGKGRELVGKLTWNRTANIVVQALEKSARERGRLK